MVTTDLQPAAVQPATLSVPSLIDHILTHYHAPHRQELPELIALAEKVERVHHDVPGAPLGLAAALADLAQELEAHMRKEELILFPALQRGAGGGVLGPIAVMRNDHDDHTEALARLERTAHHFVVPEGACGSWRRLYAGLVKFCDDLREHIQIENAILFPRFELAEKPGCTCAQG